MKLDFAQTRRLKLVDSSFEQPPRAPEATTLRLGEVLRKHELISQRDLDEALAASRARGQRLGQTLVEQGTLTQSQINWALASHLGLPNLALTDEMIVPSLVRRLPETLLRRHRVIPLLEVGDALVIAMADPTDGYAIEAVQQASGRRVKTSLAESEAISRALDIVFTQEQEQEQAAGERPRERSMLEHHLASAWADGYLELSFRPGLGAVHVTRRGSSGRSAQRSESLAGYDRLVTEVRQAAGLAPSGRGELVQVFIRQRIGTERQRVRCTILPTIHGDALTLRVVRRQSPPVLEALDGELLDSGLLDGGLLDGELLDGAKTLLARRGLVVVAGPDRPRNGELLHALLQAAGCAGIETVTLERHSAYQIEGALQIELDPAAGFATSTLTTVLAEERPSALLIDDLGAVGSEDSTRLQRTALSGALVLAGLQARDPHAALLQLTRLGDPALLGEALQLFVFRVVLRRLCSHCKQPNEQGVDTPLLADLHLDAGGTARVGPGCALCGGSGYDLGRPIGLHALIDTRTTALGPHLDAELDTMCASLWRRARELIGAGEVAPAEALALASLPAQAPSMETQR